MNKNSSILNNNFYIFILILLLIIMLFMLSPKNPEGFNINVSKIKLNSNEQFQAQTVNNNFNFSQTVDKSKTYLTLHRDIVNDTYILKNDIIKLYDNTKDEDSAIIDIDFYYFHILNVEYNEENHYKLEVINNDTFAAFNNKTKLNRAKVMGNKYENTLLSSELTFSRSLPSSDGDYELTFNITKNDKNGDPVPDVEERKKLMKIFQEEEVIEIHHENIEIDDRLFFIKKNSITDGKLILNNKKTGLTITNKDQILIKKFSINEIIKEYYLEQKQNNIDYLVTKSKIENFGRIVDDIKEKINKD